MSLPEDACGAQHLPEDLRGTIPVLVAAECPVTAPSWRSSLAPAQKFVEVGPFELLHWLPPSWKDYFTLREILVLVCVLIRKLATCDACVPK